MKAKSYQLECLSSEYHRCMKAAKQAYFALWALMMPYDTQMEGASSEVGKLEEGVVKGFRGKLMDRLANQLDGARYIAHTDLKKPEQYSEIAAMDAAIGDKISH